MRRWKLLIALLLGLSLGLLGHALYDRAVFDRADRLVTLFSELCLKETQVDPEEFGLVRIDPEGRTQRWVDSKTSSFLLVVDTRCSVQTYEPHKLSESDAKSIADSIGVIVARDFPALAFDKKISTTASNPQDYWMVGWMTGAPASENRWGIYVFNERTGSDGGGSIISYKSRKNHPLSAGES